MIIKIVLSKNSFIALLLLIKKMKFTSFIAFGIKETDFYCDEIDHVQLQNSQDNTYYFHL